MQNPSDFDVFLSIAEIAGVFVGFGALISLLRDREAGGAVALRVVISIGLVVLVAALIPVALTRYGLHGHVLWAWSSGAFLVICWAAILAPISDSEARQVVKDDARANPVLALFFWGFEISIQVPLFLALLGTAASLAPAFYVTALIVNLAQAAFVLARLVFSQDTQSIP